MQTTIEQTLYPDPQAQTAAGFCPICGGEVYAPGMYCARCERGAAR